MFRIAGAEAPPAPRDASPEVVQSLRNHGSFLRLFGAIYAGVAGLLVLVFGVLAAASVMPLGAMLGTSGAGLVGLLLYLFGRRSHARAVEVFRRGTETMAETISVERNFMIKKNGQHPWRVRYRFEVDGKTHETAVHYWTIQKPATKPGERIVVLYDEAQPSRNVIWSNLGAPEETKAREAHAEAVKEVGPRGARIAAASARDDEDAFSEEFVDEDEVKLKRRGA